MVFVSTNKTYLHDVTEILMNVALHQATVSLKVVNVDVSVLLRVTIVSLIVRIYDKK